jgi:methylase of polypeptide subunit release factors
MADTDVVRWHEAGAARSAAWRSESSPRPPHRVEIGDDRTRADDAFRRACEGVSLLFRGTWGNLHQLLAALARRVDARRRPPPADLAEAFRAHRQHQAYSHQVLSKLLVELDARYQLALSRGPDVREACREVWGPCEKPSVTTLKQLLGMVGAHEWRKAGIRLPALGDTLLRPHFGVFAPIRSEYVDLVAQAPLGVVQRAFDLGTGTGVLAFVLARRGVPRVVATELEPRALQCARENAAAFRLEDRVEIAECDLFPDGRADLVVFNPPWLPERPHSRAERALFDPGHSLVHRFLRELPEHLSPGGEAWLLLSDLGERLGVTPPGLVREVAMAKGLAVVGESTAKARHRRAGDESDPLFAARSQETTHLYRLAPAR